MSVCPFCFIVRKEEHANVVQRWPDAVAFRPLNPVTPGHVLVVPNAHVVDFTHDPIVTAAVMARASEYAYRLNIACNLITSARPEATQTVMHLHLHVVPRREGDGLALPWSGQREAV